MKKVNNQMIAGILLIAFALIALAIALMWSQRSGSSAATDSGRSNDTSTNSSVTDNGGTQDSADEVDEVVEEAVATEVTNSGNDSVEAEPVASLDSWLAYVNSIRSSAGIPPVVEDDGLSNGARLHAGYVVVNDEYNHDEDPNLPNYRGGSSRPD